LAATAAARCSTWVGRGEFLHGFAELGFSATASTARARSSRASRNKSWSATYERGGLPFKTRIFRRFQQTVFEHVRDITPLLDECHRVLEPTGGW